jgi:hypothetical protein
MPSPRAKLPPHADTCPAPYFGERKSEREPNYSDISAKVGLNRI